MKRRSDGPPFFIALQAVRRYRVAMPYVYLAIAIIAEVLATTTLKSSDGFTKPLPSLASIVGYSTAFYCLSLCLRTLDVGYTYAIWCGVGIVLVTIAAALVYKQVPDLWSILGMSLIILGVVVLNVFAKNAAH